MNVELDLKKIESLELDKKNLLVKLFDANEFLNNVKIEKESKHKESTLHFLLNLL